MSGPALRDIHLPPAPGWWPPAPGWWLLAAAILAIAIWLTWLASNRWRRARRRHVLLAEFDRQLATAPDTAAELAAMSSLLRRAARWRSTEAAALAGEAWLRYLDGADPARPFSAGPGRLLDEGPYRARIDEPLDALRALVRRRFLALMEAGDA